MDPETVPLSRTDQFLAQARAELALESLAGTAVTSSPETARWLEEVVAETRLLLAPLEEIRQYRLLAQANSYLGIAAWRLAALAERQNDPARARGFYIQARDALAACEDQVKRSPEDRTLAETIVAGSCTPAKQEVLKAIGP